MHWVVVVGFFTLLALFMSVALLLRIRRLQDLRELPDGDYTVVVEAVRVTPKGVETVYMIKEPSELEGRRVTMVLPSVVAEDVSLDLPDEEFPDSHF